MPATVTTRAAKGSALTNTEMDANLTNLKAAADAATAAQFADADVPGGVAGADTGLYLRVKIGATFYKIALKADA